jgi:hypothetical protein
VLIPEQENLLGTGYLQLAGWVRKAHPDWVGQTLSEKP